jgi:hypothetical protein
MALSRVTFMWNKTNPLPRFGLSLYACSRAARFTRGEINRIISLVVENREALFMPGMSSSAAEPMSGTVLKVTISEDTLAVDLSDGRTIAVPLAWYPRLLHANHKERMRFRLIGGGEGIHWPDLEEDISVAAMLSGHASNESSKSLQRWLDARENRG